MEAFDFPDAMRKSRQGLEKLLVKYAAEHPEMGYRRLSEKFYLSLGAISKIMKRWESMRRNMKRYEKHLRKVEREFGWLKTEETAQGAGNDESHGVRVEVARPLRGGV